MRMGLAWVVVNGMGGAFPCGIPAYDAIASGLFGGKECLVGAVEKFVEVDTGVSAVDCGNTEAGGDGEDALVDGDGGLGEVDAQAFGDALGVFEIGFRENDGEFFAAVASDQVAGTQGGAAVVGEGAEHLVACGVAIDVVDLLEVVDVHHDGGKRVVGAECMVEFAVGEFEEVAAVVEAGERVGDGGFLDCGEEAGVLDGDGGGLGEEVKVFDIAGIVVAVGVDVADADGSNEVVAGDKGDGKDGVGDGRGEG